MTSRFTHRQIWHHNSFFGFVALAEKNMFVILDSVTATKESKVIAHQIIRDLDRLKESLKIRNESP